MSLKELSDIVQEHVDKQNGVATNDLSQYSASGVGGLLGQGMTWGIARREEKAMPNSQDRQIGGNHYRQMDVQPWDAMKSWLSPEAFAGFLRGNVIKYIARAGKKGDEMQDLEKAAHYLEALIEFKRGMK